MDKNKKIFFAFIVLLSIVIYFPLLNSFFFQDDFFHFKMAEAQSLADFVNFFSFKNNFDYSFYRPLSTQVFLFVTKTLFGYEPFFFHLIGFVFFILNTFLVFKISERVIKDSRISILAAFLYAINPSNLASLSYISVFEEISMAFFLLLAFFYYLKNSKVAIIFFILSLLCRENALVLPAILTVYEFILGKKQFKKIIPFGIVLVGYILLRVGVGIPDTSVYQLVLTPKKFLNSYFWYFIWGMGWPEMFVDYIGPGFKINQNLFLWYNPRVILIFITSAVSSLLFGVGIIKSKTTELKITIFLLSIFAIGLLPVIFWPWHKFIYYLTVPVIGLLTAYLYSLSKLSKLLLSVGLVTMTATCLLSQNLMRETYWAVNRAKISRNLVEKLKENYPTLPKGASLYFTNDPGYPEIPGFGNSSTQASYVLSGVNGPQVIYHDYSLKVFYEDFGVIPQGENVFAETAKIVQ